MIRVTIHPMGSNDDPEVFILDPETHPFINNEKVTEKDLVAKLQEVYGGERGDQWVTFETDEAWNIESWIDSVLAYPVGADDGDFQAVFPGSKEFLAGT